MANYLKNLHAYNCPRCNSLFHHQLHRNIFMKALSVIVPVRYYYCAKCKTGRYVMLKKAPLQNELD